MANPICLSPLKFYDSLDKQEHRKSYAYGHISPLIVKANVIPTFQFVVPSSVQGIAQVYAVSKDERIDVSASIKNALSIEEIDGYKLLILKNSFPIVELKYEGIYYLEVVLSNEEQGYIERVISLYAKGVYEAWTNDDLADWVLSQGSVASIESNALTLSTDLEKTGSLTYNYAQTQNQKIDILWNPGNATGHNSYYSYIKFGNVVEIRFYGQTTTSTIIIKGIETQTLDAVSNRNSDRTIHIEFDGILNYVKLVYTESGLSSHTFEISTDDIQVSFNNISIGFNTPRLPNWTNSSKIINISLTSEEREERQLSSDYTFFSEMFCCTNHLDDCLLIEYWNKTGNFAIKNGIIAFQKGFKFSLYLKSELGKPEYNFEEEATKRLGYSYIESQVSKKIHKFNTVIPEYICDAMRLIRLCSDKILVSKGEVYDMLSFDMDVEWQQQGDLASVSCEFETDNVVINLGGFVPEDIGGDFENSHFNNDFDNQ